MSELKKQIKGVPIDPNEQLLSIADGRTFFLGTDSAVSYANRLSGHMKNVAQSQDDLTHAANYLTSPFYRGFIRVVDFVSRQERAEPSLGALLDSQQIALGTYRGCLGEIIDVVESQQNRVGKEVDQLEGQLRIYGESADTNQLEVAKNQFKQKKDRKTRRALLSSLLDQRLYESEQEQHKQLFSDFSAHEDLLLLMRYSLCDMRNQAQSFERYVEKSKGVFICAASISEALDHFLPHVDAMKNYTRALKQGTLRTAQLLRDESNRPLDDLEYVTSVNDLLVDSLTQNPEDKGAINSSSGPINYIFSLPQRLGMRKSSK